MWEGVVATNTKKLFYVKLHSLNFTQLGENGTDFFNLVPGDSDIKFEATRE